MKGASQQEDDEESQVSAHMSDVEDLLDFPPNSLNEQQQSSIPFHLKDEDTQMLQNVSMLSPPTVIGNAHTAPSSMITPL
jgi:hypothetical protein